MSNPDKRPNSWKEYKKLVASEYEAAKAKQQQLTEQMCAETESISEIDSKIEQLEKDRRFLVSDHMSTIATRCEVGERMSVLQKLYKSCSEYNPKPRKQSPYLDDF